MNPGTPTGRGLKEYRDNTRDIIVYKDIREDFIKWMLGKTSKEYTKQLIRYLDKYLGDRTISGPKDVLEVLSRTTGKKHTILALRNLVNYCELLGLISPDKAYSLKRVLKCVKSGVDGYIPTDEEVVAFYRKLKNEKYRMIFKFLAYSGLRIREVARILSNYDEDRVIVTKNIAKYPLFSDRGTKRAYFAYMPKDFLPELKRITISEKTIRNYFYTHGFPAKYLRKWNYNFMILNNVPESVADFIQGRAPISIGSMHYLAKVRQADEWYSRIADKLVRIFE